MWRRSSALVFLSAALDRPRHGGLAERLLGVLHGALAAVACAFGLAGAGGRGHSGRSGWRGNWRPRWRRLLRGRAAREPERRESRPTIANYEKRAEPVTFQLPLGVKGSRERTQVAPDLRLELFAAEPEQVWSALA